ncbi:methyl-accepting chemotaxis protein [Zarconia navalis]|uniref:methyl-accepting chemotaxis protein n=1 Tax=Zarconia navalis TaxID=2992134 RepID=UPI0021F8DE98|nr:methyl-accepting chemotaxis protein [Zarconia navalis]
MSLLSSGVIWQDVRQVKYISNRLQGDVMVFEQITRLALNTEGLVKETQNYLLEQDPATIDIYELEVEEFRTSVRRLEATIEDETLKITLRQIFQQVIALDEIARELIQLVEQNQISEAIAGWNEQDTQIRSQQIESLLNAFVERSKGLVEKREERQQDALRQLVFVAVGATGLSVLAGIGVGTRIANGIAKKMKKSAGIVGRSAANIATAVEQQERAATQQAVSVHQTTTTMDELESSARKVMEQIEAAAIRAREVLNRTEIGTQTVTRILDEMTVLKDKSGAISHQILHLSDRTSQIGNISTLVSDLSDRTHMLALNAAVEAVRAGEHGKGFSIVASEIRQLADESKKSTEKIHLLIADIQKAIDSTVRATDEGTQSVEVGVQISRETSEVFLDIQQAIGDVVLNNQQISLNIKQQVSAVGQVVDAMNALNTAARETAGGITQVKLGTQKLNEAALELEEMV